MSTQTRKRKERDNLVQRVNSLGVEMIPCSYCERHEKSCVIAKGSSKCGECIRTSWKCDAKGIPLWDQAALDREEHRLETTKMVAKEMLRKAQAKAQEATSQLLRLRKQRRFLKDQGKDMLRCGLKTLDKLDEVEERERQEKEAKERSKQEAQRVNALLSLDFFVDSNDPFLFAMPPLDSSSRTLPTSLGNSS